MPGEKEKSIEPLSLPSEEMISFAKEYKEVLDSHHTPFINNKSLLSPENTSKYKDDILDIEFRYATLNADLEDLLSGQIMYPQSELEALKEKITFSYSDLYLLYRNFISIISSLPAEKASASGNVDDIKQKNKEIIDKFVETAKNRFHKVKTLFDGQTDDVKKEVGQEFEALVQEYTVYDEELRDGLEVESELDEQALEAYALEFILETEKVESLIKSVVDARLETDNKEKIIEERATSGKEGFKRWQSADESLFKAGWWNELGAIRSDIGMFLSASGYSNSEIDSIFAEKINDWSSRVVELKKIRRGVRGMPDLHREILSYVSEKLSGREPDDEKLKEHFNTILVRDESINTEVGFGVEAAPEPETILELDVQISSLFGRLSELESALLPLQDTSINYILSDVVNTLATARDYVHDNQTEVFNNKKKYLKIAKAKLIRNKIKLNKVIDYAEGGKSDFYAGEPEAVVAPVTADTEPKTVEEIEEEVKIVRAEFKELYNVLLRRSLSAEEISSVDTIIDEIEEVYVLLKGGPTDTDKTVDLDNKKWNLKKFKTKVEEFKKAAEAIINPVATTPVTPEPIPVSAPDTLPLAPDSSLDPLDISNFDLMDYQDARKSWAERREKKEGFIKLKTEYENGVKTYYENRDWQEKIRSSASSFMGLSPKFPPELATLKLQYDEARQVYARELKDLLELRSKAHAGNVDRSLDKDEVKKAFAQRFILSPSQKLLKIQEDTLMKEAEKSRLKSIMKLMSKHKWGIRVGTVVLAGTIGAVTGGAGLAVTMAGSRALRMGASIFGGMAAGVGVNKAMQGFVDKGEVKVNATENRIKKDFSIGDMRFAERELEWAKADTKRRESLQKVATIMAAGTAGFSAGLATATVTGSASSIDKTNPAPARPASSPDIPVNPSVAEVAEALNNSASPGTQAGGIRADAPPLPGTETATEPDLAASATELAASAPNSSVSELGRVTPMFDNVPRIVAVEVANGKGFELIVPKVELITAVEGASPLSVDRLMEVQKFAKLAIDDGLAGSPNIRPQDLEKFVLEKLNNRFTGQDWWRDAKVTKVSMPTITRTPADFEFGKSTSQPTIEDSAMTRSQTDRPQQAAVSQPATSPELEKSGQKIFSQYVDSGESTNSPSSTAPSVESATRLNLNTIPDSGPKVYTVVEGDNLWNIVKTTYADNLRGLSDTEKGRVLNNLFDKVSADESLRKSIGLNGANPRLIYANQELRIDVLGRELGKILGGSETGTRPVGTEMASRPKTGPLSVAGASPEQSVKIKVVPPAKDLSYQAEATNEKRYVGIDNKVPPPKPYQDPLYTIPKASVEPVVAPSPEPIKIPEPIKTPSSNPFGSYEFQAYLQENGLNSAIVEDTLDKFIQNFEGNKKGFFTEVFADSRYDSPYKELSKLPLSKAIEIYKTAKEAGGSDEALLQAIAPYAPEKTFDIKTLRGYENLINQAAIINKGAFNQDTTIEDMFKRMVAQDLINRNNAINNGPRSLLGRFTDKLNASNRYYPNPREKININALFDKNSTFNRRK